MKMLLLESNLVVFQILAAGQILRLYILAATNILVRGVECCG